MTTDQLIVFAVLAATLGLFLWNRWRFDVVAGLSLLAVVLLGVVSPEEAFRGAGHPAVITVAAVLVVSRGLLDAGVVDAVARLLTKVGNRPWVQVATLSAIVALSSGFMNNVGALALFMPVAIWMSRQSGRSPAVLLMPIAFASLLGGMLTMIGTPPNIIIATYRAEAADAAFGMFDFFPVGGGIALAGLLFIATVGWRLVPVRERQDAYDELFDIGAYMTELRVPPAGKYVGRTLHDLLTAVKDEAEVMVIALVREGSRTELPSMFEVLRGGDILLAEADSESLESLLEVTDLELAEGRGRDGEARETSAEDLNIAEAIVTADSPLVGRTATSLDLREKYGVNILAVARQGHRLRKRVGNIQFVAGDIILAQAREGALQSSLGRLGCLPLASRGLRIPKPPKVVLACTLFGAALALIGFGVLDAAVGLTAAALAMVLTGLVPTKEIYKSVDWPIIVLLAAMLPVGGALESTGASTLIAQALYDLGRWLPPAATLGMLTVSVMLLSNILNNAAAAVLAAPIGVSLAQEMGASPDPFLMAVAVGASAAFLTPIGHQSNTLVMAPGGYRFGDYWRLGLPLSALVVASAIPLILWFWPL